MSMFWSTWVQALVIFNMGITFFLFIFAIRTRIPTIEDGTTGHVWAHGRIREGLHNLPVWWILGSAAWFLAAWTYLVLYPGFGRLPGVLGWSSHQQLEEQLQANDARLQLTYDQFRNVPLERLALDEDAHRIGHRIFVDNCSACHGRNGDGNVGFPRLNDTFWTWGGSPDDILATITNGRNGMMAPVGAALGEDGTRAVANYVASLSGIEHDAALVESGKEKFGTICSACHGPDAKGNTLLGAPDLTAGIFLRSVGVPGIIETIDKGRSGEMPAWSGRLSEDEIRLVAAWVIGNVDHGTKVSAHP